VLMGAVYFGVIRVQRQSLEELPRNTPRRTAALPTASASPPRPASFRKNWGRPDQNQGHRTTMASGDMYSWIILTMNSFKESGNYKVEIPQFSREIPSDVGLLAKFPIGPPSFTSAVPRSSTTSVALSLISKTLSLLRIQNIELDPASGSASTAAAAGNPGDNEKLSFKMEIVTLVNRTRTDTPRFHEIRFIFCPPVLASLTLAPGLPRQRATLRPSSPPSRRRLPRSRSSSSIQPKARTRSS